VLLNLGSDLVKKNKINEALEAYQLNIKLYPGNPYAHYYLGLAYEKNGQNTLAVKHLKKALEMLPTWVSAKKKLEELNKK